MSNHVLTAYEVMADTQESSAQRIESGIDDWQIGGGHFSRSHRRGASRIFRFTRRGSTSGPGVSNTPREVPFLFTMTKSVAWTKKDWGRLSCFHWVFATL